MRLLYLLVDDLDPDPVERARLTDHGQRLMAPGDTFTVEPIAFGPRHYYESAAGFALCVPGVMHSVRTRQQDHDAVLIGCFGDPGLRAARTVARIPVVGGCEASVALSHFVAQRFGIVTVEPGDVPEIAARLAELEVSHRCVGIEAVEIPFYALVDDPEETLARVERCARELIGRGAQAIVLGCMSFGFGPFAERAQQGLGIPVINPVRAGVAAARAALALGAGVSRRWVLPVEDEHALDEFLERLDEGRSASPTRFALERGLYV